MKTISSRIVYENRWMRVREDAIERADGTAGIYGVIEKPDFALIIPIEEEHVYLVEQLRYPVGARFLEFPQGTWEQNPTADPADVARGELQEETGLLADRMDYLGHLYIAYGMSNQGFHIFRATGLTQGEPSLEPEEQDLTVKRVTIAEFESMIQSGGIKDAGTISAWMLLKMYEARPGGERI
ncbi:MAG TPA: NUDIX hydrolase [Acidisarcina sp.]|nr:NUDIX hydrolase [Acidisarcina sp.]